MRSCPVVMLALTLLCVASLVRVSWLTFTPPHWLVATWEDGQRQARAWQASQGTTR